MRLARRSTPDRTAADRELDQSRAYLCAAVLRKSVSRAFKKREVLDDGLIDLASGDIVKVVTMPENGMCHVNNPGKWPVLVTMELVTTEWLEPINANFKEREYCGAMTTKHRIVLSW